MPVFILLRLLSCIVPSRTFVYTLVLAWAIMHSSILLLTFSRPGHYPSISWPVCRGTVATFFISRPSRRLRTVFLCQLVR